MRFLDTSTIAPKKEFNDLPSVESCVGREGDGVEAGDSAGEGPAGQVHALPSLSSHSVFVRQETIIVADGARDCG